jgi:excisionase family DNA binding protein
MQNDQDASQPVLLMTVRQVARTLGISRSMVYLIIQRGELRCIHIGRAMRVSRSEVRRYINERENAQQMPTRSVARSQKGQTRKA